MKTLLFLLLFTSMAHAQLFQFLVTERAFGDFSAAVVIDPYASYKEKGLNIGVELDLQCYPIYIRPSLTNFAALEDGYTDFTLALGPNFALGRFNQIRYYSGIRMGLIWREGAVPHPTAGFEAGINYQPFNKKIYYGLRATYDRRGDSEFYDGPKWRESGFILVGFRF
jgi:hypothetical protein